MKWIVYIFLTIVIFQVKAFAGLSTGEFDRKNLDRQRAIEAYYARLDEKKLSSFEKKRAEADRGRLLGIYSG